MDFTLGSDNLSATRQSNDPGYRTHFPHPVAGVDGIVVFAEWQHIQPSSFGELKQNNIIDRAIAAVSLWNAEHPGQIVKIRLRALAGVHSPQWVKDYAGALDVDWCKAELCDTKLRTFSIPKFWTPAYHEAWEDFQTKLAAKYDSEPLIADVSIAGQGTLHTEVTWRHYSFPFAFKQLVAGGLRLDQDLKYWKRDISFMMETWPQTPVEMTFNGVKSYEVNQDGEPVNLSAATTEIPAEILTYMRSESQRLGNKRYFIANHTLGPEDNIDTDTTQDPNHIQYLLAQEQQKGATLYYQTQVFTSDYTAQLLDIAANLGAILVETSQGETPGSILSAAVQAGRARLKQNIPLTDRVTLADRNVSLSPLQLDNQYGQGNVMTLYSDTLTAFDGKASFRIAADVQPTADSQLVTNSLGYWGINNPHFSGSEQLQSLTNLRVVDFQANGSDLSAADISNLSFKILVYTGANDADDQGFIDIVNNHIDWQDLDSTQTTSRPGFTSSGFRSKVYVKLLNQGKNVSTLNLGASNNSGTWRIADVIAGFQESYRLNQQSSNIQVTGNTVSLKPASATQFGPNNTVTLKSDPQIGCESGSSFEITAVLTPTPGSQIVSNSNGNWGIDNVHFSANEQTGEISQITVQPASWLSPSSQGWVTNLEFKWLQLNGANTDNATGFIQVGGSNHDWQDLGSVASQSRTGFSSDGFFSYADLVSLAGASRPGAFNLGARNSTDIWRVGDIKVNYQLLCPSAS
ncbi:hypothetical protein [Shewanella sp. GXUN23E]|uniref:hypothetical protein n=1 Tax=Shewanella sp. GXUN23E TaxID=3422498 RepID=UPI003D7E7BFE